MFKAVISVFIFVYTIQLHFCIGDVVAYDLNCDCRLRSVICRQRQIESPLLYGGHLEIHICLHFTAIVNRIPYIHFTYNKRFAGI